MQPLDQLRLPTAVRGQVQQPVRVAGVAATQLRHPELQPVGRGALLHLLLCVLRLRGRHAVLAGEHVGRRLGRIRGRARVQLERAVDHLHLVAMLERCQPPLEPALSRGSTRGRRRRTRSLPACASQRVASRMPSHDSPAAVSRWAYREQSGHCKDEVVGGDITAAWRQEPQGQLHGDAVGSARHPDRGRRDIPTIEARHTTSSTSSTSWQCSGSSAGGSRGAGSGPRRNTGIRELTLPV